MVKQLLLSAMMVMTLMGCDQATGPKETLTVLAGSELKDMEPKLADIEKATGITLKFDYIGTLDGADKLMHPNHYDLGWFSHAKYLTLLQGEHPVIKASEQIGLSPVIPAVKTSLAKKWGWIDNTDVTWADLAAKAKAGQFHYAMTDPSASNSGFSTVIGVQAAFSGSGDALTVKSIDQARLKGFFAGQQLTSGSSGWLATTYEKDQDRLDGLFNYESILLSMNASGRLKEPLTLIYPKDGVVTADYPLLLLNKDKQAAYTRLVTYLKTPEFQTWMMEHTNRRPVLPSVKLNKKFPKKYLMELPFPAKLETVNAMLMSFLNEQRKPDTSIFVLDTSGSMAGDGRIKQLKQALLNLSGADHSLTGQFARFRDREKVIMVPFNSTVGDIHSFTIQGPASLTAVGRYAKTLEPGGGTSIYEALTQAYSLAEHEKQAHPDRLYSIVLMTDGVNTSGEEYGAFHDWYLHHSDTLVNIRTFPILFGSSNEQEMNDIAQLTGGRSFDGRQAGLSRVFKKIRGYQ